MQAAYTSANKQQLATPWEPATRQSKTCGLHIQHMFEKPSRLVAWTPLLHSQEKDAGGVKVA